MLDFYPDEEEINLADNNVLEVISDTIERKTIFFPCVRKAQRTWICCTQTQCVDNPLYPLPF